MEEAINQNNVSVSNDPLMPHKEDVLSGPGRIASGAELGQPVQLLSIPTSDLGKILEPKAKKWPIALLVLALLFATFVLYEYALYRALLEQSKNVVR